MKDPTYAPMYVALYPGLAKIARAHGYALAVHGTLGRDMDLICVPWSEAPSDPATVVKEITTEFHIRTVGEPDMTHHGRERWTITVGFGECFLDLSFMPRAQPNGVPADEDERAKFEADAEPYDFDLTRQQLAVPEPWSEYVDQATGHRWGGWLARAGVPAGEADRRDALYMELLLAVGKKYPGESRHETALRYIRNAEVSTSDDGRAAQPNDTKGSAP